MMVRRRSDIDWYSVFLAAFSHDSAVDDSSNSAVPVPQAPATKTSVVADDVMVDDDGPHFRLTHAAPKAIVGLGPNVPSASMGVSDFSKIPTLAIDGSSNSPATWAEADVTMVSSDDEQRQESPGRQKRLEEPHSEFEERFDTGTQVDEDDGVHFQLTRQVAKATVGLGPDVPSSMGVFNFSLVDEDEQGEHVGRKHCSKPSPKFTGQKDNNSGQLPLNKVKSQGHGGKRKPYVNKRKDHVMHPEEYDNESSLPSRFTRRKQQL